MKIFYGMSFTQGFSILIAPLKENRKKGEEEGENSPTCSFFVVKTRSAQSSDSIQQD